MDADWSVELAAEDPALEFPWSSPDDAQRFVDLIRNPNAVADIPEAQQHAALHKLLTDLNSPISIWQTVKCDVWHDDEIGEAEEVFGGAAKVGSYVDLIRRSASERFSFVDHEGWVKAFARAADSPDDDHGACEFIVRRCYYHSQSQAGDSTPGYYITAYVFGYGDTDAQAQSAWNAALARVSTVLLALPA